jgi:hypothetical protein
MRNGCSCINPGGNAEMDAEELNLQKHTAHDHLPLKPCSCIRGVPAIVGFVLPQSAATSLIRHGLIKYSASA